ECAAGNGLDGAVVLPALHRAGPGVGDVQPAVAVERKAGGPAQPLRDVAGDLSRAEGAGDFADGVVAGVGHVEVAGAVEDESCGRVEGRVGRGPAVAAGPATACAPGDGRDGAASVDHPDRAVPAVADVHVPR